MKNIIAAHSHAPSAESRQSKYFQRGRKLGLCSYASSAHAKLMIA